ncbi:asparaginase [Serpentinicella sp. ANB-PHB4]|uniref:asparaginase n=1 Tax=Serpentinicella sp. ANB-PHB4 TaxID=3074076 RepID=UPI00285B026E|nr:asparaginase [Serpentinicella sp. ANB-PHB4]MDR5660049.1 asparaginase [Serpentinicella sp. ANB-PHB4]
MSKPKVAIIFTGGTISMSIDPRIGAAIPSLENDEILSLVTNIDKYAKLDVINFSNIPGPHMTPHLMMELKEIVEAQLLRDDICGVIVTHGTDTLEETGYLLDLTINNDKPIVMVGAMRNSSELGYDGPSNLAAAVCTAISPLSRKKGTLVVMNNEVNAASEVTKTNTLSLNTFKSLDFGPLGIVDNDEVIFYRKVISRQHIMTNQLNTNVDLIKCVSGMNSKLIECSINTGAKGIILEAMGRGNIPPEALKGVELAIKSNIAVVLVSRCPTGRVMDNYGYEGGGNELRKMGIIFGGDLAGQKARIKLMLALGKTSNLDNIREIIENNQYQ